MLSVYYNAIKTHLIEYSEQLRTCVTRMIKVHVHVR